MPKRSLDSDAKRLWLMLAAADNEEDKAKIKEQLQQIAGPMLAKIHRRKGDKYFFGVRVSQDFEKGARWYQMAAEEGDSNAQYILALIYLKGELLPKDDRKGTFWLKEAAKQENMEELERRLERRMRKQGIERTAF